ncbi:aldo/keto reductase [Nocardia aurantia]|uniref:Aldo-keto reductase IolS n=1 Tax=Nocardia aurantia TaxID=2585199 RepID=A0A7K0DJ58_9NOCA|nr:aldo/keto reductase [Nocardia aurantia]MQY25856.1 Aldo-keto reductase IolS [Nocardia aurantia]
MSAPALSPSPSTAVTSPPARTALPEGFRAVGRSGLVVSEVGIGASTFGRTGMIADSQTAVDAIVGRALDLGITYFDVADVYGERPGQSETMLGKALGRNRDRVVIGSKFGIGLDGLNGPDWGVRGSRRYVRLAVESSLRRLGTDWIDLYQIHTPDPVTPIEETLSVLDDLVREGKIRYIGSSNFAGWQVADAEYVARIHGLTRFVSATNEYNLLWREPATELLPALAAYGLGFFPYFPLQNGLLTGKYRRDTAPADAKITNLKKHLLDAAPWDALDRYAEFARQRGVTPTALAFGWLLAHESVSSVIAGITRPEQLDDNLSAARWRPSPAEFAELSALFTGDLSGAPGQVTGSVPA